MRLVRQTVLLLAGCLLTSAAVRAQEDEFEIPAGGTAVHGTVQPGGTADHLVLHDEQGGTVDLVTSPNTRIRRSRAPIKLSDIHAGEALFAFGTFDGQHHTLHALVVGVLDATELKRAQEDLGKTFITGTVISITDLHLLIRRPDGVRQTIAVDETTSFKRAHRRQQGAAGTQGQPGTDAPAPSAGDGAGEESVTLADVHPGSYILANGALQAGVFVPTTLRVFPPLATTNAQAARTPRATERTQEHPQ